MILVFLPHWPTDHLAQSIAHRLWVGAALVLAFAWIVILDYFAGCAHAHAHTFPSKPSVDPGVLETRYFTIQAKNSFGLNCQMNSR